MAQVELDLFSGRPNPAWQLDESRTRQLQQLVASLSPASTGPPDPPGLGYRGFRIRVGDQLYRVWDGHVLTPSAHLADPGRTVEGFLLDQLPPQFQGLRRLVETSG